MPLSQILGLGLVMTIRALLDELRELDDNLVESQIVMVSEQQRILSALIHYLDNRMKHLDRWLFQNTPVDRHE